MIHGKSLMFDAKEVQLFVYYIGDRGCRTGI